MKNRIATGVILTAALPLALGAVWPPSTWAGPFTATVTGGTTAQLSGTATSLSGASPPAFSVQLRDANGTSGILLIREAARPTPGTYAVASTAEHGGNAPNGEFTALVRLGGRNILSSVSGTVTIDASSPSAVSGSFSFTTENPMSGGPATVTGTFEAENEEVP